MGYTLGLPVLKLNNTGRQSKHCGDFQKILAEAFERAGKDLDIDHSRSHLNQTLGMSDAELLKYSEEHIKELTKKQRAAGKRGIRQDAVVMVATIIQPPKEFLMKLTKTDRIRFLNDAYHSLKEIVGSERMKSCILHNDEQSEHLHSFWEPMTDDGRLCAKEVVNLKFYNKLNKELPIKLREKGWKEIDDCFAFDKAEYDAMSPEEKKAFWEKKKNHGRTSKKYKADQDAARAEFELQMKEAENKLSKLTEEINDKENELKIVSSELQNKVSKSSELDSEIVLKENYKKALEDDFERQKDDFKTTIAEMAKIKIEFDESKIDDIEYINFFLGLINKIPYAFKEFKDLGEDLLERYKKDLEYQRKDDIGKLSLKMQMEAAKTKLPSSKNKQKTKDDDLVL